MLILLESLLHAASDCDLAEAVDCVLVPLESLLHAASDCDLAEAADCVLVPLESLLHVASDCDLAEAAQRVSLLPLCSRTLFLHLQASTHIGAQVVVGAKAKAPSRQNGVVAVLTMMIKLYCS
jgi:hypothetical protein